MKKLLVVLITLGLLLAPISAVQAQSNGETVTVNLSFDNTVYVNAGDYIMLTHGWGACTRGLVKLYLSAVYTEVHLDGVLISMADGKDQHWGPITESTNTSWASCIAGDKESGWVSNWQYPLGALSTGEYEVHFYYWLDHPIHDGGDYDNDGRPDLFEGLLQDRTITIIVN
jgi:hypothetical protein